MAQMTLSSPAFDAQGRIPAKYTCEGDNVNPPLHIHDTPQGTRSLALIVDDPDAPAGTWTHWVVWNINPRIPEIAENAVPREAYAGKNTWHSNSYGGPCPPSGKSHRYFFKLYALDTVLELAGSSSRDQLEEAMEGHVIASAELVGVFGRA